MCENKNCKCNGSCGENCKCKAEELGLNLDGAQDIEIQPEVDNTEVDELDCCVFCNEEGHDEYDEVEGDNYHEDEEVLEVDTELEENDEYLDYEDEDDETFIEEEIKEELQETCENMIFDFEPDPECYDDCCGCCDGCCCGCPSDTEEEIDLISNYIECIANAVVDILMDSVIDVAFAAKEGVEIPYKRDEDMGFDVKAHFDEHEFVIKPHETRLVPTGLYSALPFNFGLLAREKGSTGSIGMKLGAGVIDAGYRDEIFIPITNTNDVPIVITKDETLKKVDVNEDMISYPYKKGIAQLIVTHNPKVNIVPMTIDELKSIPSERGEGKLGSTDNL